MSDLVKLGEFPKGGDGRDAIHVAIVPVFAVNEMLLPGCHIGFEEGSTEVVTAMSKNLIGIVDPFLTQPVKPGQKFWLCLYPYSITGLCHVWTHPAFEKLTDQQVLSLDKAKSSPLGQATVEAAEQWLKNFAAEWDMVYSNMVDSAENGDYIVAGTDLHSNSELGEDYDKFWKNMEIVTGKKFSEAHKEEAQFTCSC